MHQALYRKWRPSVFDDVYGQEHITSVLRYEAENKKFSHAYLFCGSRGTGKTTCAKILAKVINCEHPENGNPCGKCEACLAIESGAATDVIEMDAASNNGVDNIRDIKDAVSFAPASLRCRVYIIDEVHMLSGSAFNALLKTLEEPPEYVVFILATTELQKLPATIVSRCQRFDFRRISTEDLCARLSEISKNEGIEADDKALTLIARNAQGGMRDAISLLELCSGAHKKITAELVNDTIGSSGREQTMSVVDAVIRKDYDRIFADVDEVVSSSKDITVFWQELISLYRDMLVVKTTPSHAERYLDLTKDETDQLVSLTSKFTRETLLHHCYLLDNALYSMQRANTQKRITAEMTLIKMCDDTLNDSNAALLSRISKLERALAAGEFKAASVSETVSNDGDSDIKSEKKASREAAKASDKDPSIREDKADKVPENTAKGQAKLGSASEASVPQSSGGERVLRKFKAWADALEHITSNSPMVAGLIKAGSAYITNSEGRDVFIIKLSDNSFTKTMMDQFGGKLQIRTALCVTLGKDIPETDIFIEYESSGEKSNDTVIDEILDNLD